MSYTDIIKGIYTSRYNLYITSPWRIFRKRRYKHELDVCMHVYRGMNIFTLAYYTRIMLKNTTKSQHEGVEDKIRNISNDCMEITINYNGEDITIIYNNAYRTFENVRDDVAMICYDYSGTSNKMQTISESWGRIEPCIRKVFEESMLQLMDNCF